MPNSLIDLDPKIEASPLSRFHTPFLIFASFLPGKPEGLKNCTTVNQTYESLSIKCEPGFSGGMEQSFILEVSEPKGSAKRRIGKPNKEGKKALSSIG